MLLRPPFPGKVVVALLLATWLCVLRVPVRAQTASVLQRAEQALCDGDDLSAERSLLKLLAEPALERSARFDALMLMAEIHYQGFGMERFLALSDSASLLLDPTNEKDNEAWSLVETNRCRYAHYAMLFDRAVEQGEAALARYRRAKDKHNWKHAYRIHQSLAAAYRNNARVSGKTIFLHFDTSLALVNARTDVLPYWKAMVWRSLSNAAMDRMRPGQPERVKYGALCLQAQRKAMGLLDEHYPKNHLDRAQLYNLHGLYHIYADHSDSALYWFQRTWELLGHDALERNELRAIPDLLSALRWQAIVYDQPPWNADTIKLRRFLDHLVEAEPHYARYANAEATAAGLFTRDRYHYAPYTAIVATCQRLWALTGDERYVDQALRSTERVRRDAWNTAQRFRKRQDLMLPEPPLRMLAALREQLSSDEALMICMDYALALVSHRAFTLVVTTRGLSFEVADFVSAWDYAFGTSPNSEPRDVRRSLFALHQAVYEPARKLLDDGIARLRVLSTGQFTQVPFDALLEDTLSNSLRDCHPLVEKHAISNPYFLLRHATEQNARVLRPFRYIAPAPGQGDLSDLAILRAAMAGWSKGSFPGVVDSTQTDTAKRSEIMQGPGLLLMGGHCGGQTRQSDEARHYWGTSTAEENALLPSDVLDIEHAPDVVVHAACQSGGFYLYGSTGNVSFARAFLFAGSRQVVAALDVADERSAVKLLDHFLHALDKDLPADIALQQAKLAYLREASNPEETLPLHWAVWQVWGETDEEGPESNKEMALVVGIGVLMMIGTTLFIRWRRERLNIA